MLAVVGGEALNHVRMDMPGAVLRGGTATLRCHFDLEEDALYSVKWYKGGSEFYRFTPRETPPSKAFPIPRLPQLQVEVRLLLKLAYLVKTVNLMKQQKHFKHNFKKLNSK